MKYKGKKLDIWKSIWFRKMKMGLPTELVSSLGIFLYLCSGLSYSKRLLLWTKIVPLSLIVFQPPFRFSIRPKKKNVMLPSSGKFEILGRSVDFLKFFFYCIVHEFKLITKCTSFVNQSTMTQSKENMQ